MNATPLDTDEAVRIALGTLADLARLRTADQPLLATAATRAHAALGQALASVAPHALDASA